MLRIYGVPISVHTRKVIVAAVEKGLSYEIAPVVPVIPGNPPPNWPQLSPTGKIPVLADGAHTIADSSVICAYLDRKYPAWLAYPTEDAAYISSLWFEEYADGTLFREVVHPLFFQTFVRPNVRKQPTETAVVDAVCSEAIPRVFGYLDGIVGDSFVAGPRFTIADVALASNLVTYQYLGFPLAPERYPRLHAYFKAGMFRIGEFSRIARVSARLLRFYDEIGLLAPSHADASTGYRYYTVNQLSQLNRIVVLKDLGFTLEAIGRIVGNDVSAAELRSMLLVRQSDVEQSLAVEQQRLRQIELRIAQIEMEGKLTSEDVIVRAEPARRLLSLRRTVASFAEARGLIGVLREHVRAVRLRHGSGQLVAVAHSQDFEADSIDVEFGVTLDEKETPQIPAGSLLGVNTLAAEPRVAICVRVGLPEDAHLVTARIGRFVAASGDTLAGPNREVFLQPPHPERMHESVVEMQFPLRAAQAI
jgi:glutathione S-transferase